MYTDKAHEPDIKERVVDMSLNGGENYELLFTVRPQEFEKMSTNARITAIGYLTADPTQVVLATKAGQQTPIRAQGWTRAGV